MVGLSKKENTISKVLLAKDYCYVVIGYSNGSIKIWKMSNQKQIIHSFEGHTRQIDSLINHLDNRLFW